MEQRRCSLQDLTDLNRMSGKAGAKVLSRRNTDTEAVSRRNSVRTNLRGIRLFRCDHAVQTTHFFLMHELEVRTVMYFLHLGPDACD